MLGVVGFQRGGRQLTWIWKSKHLINKCSMGHSDCGTQRGILTDFAMFFPVSTPSSYYSDLSRYSLPGTCPLHPFRHLGGRSTVLFEFFGSSVQFSRSVMSDSL